MQVITEQRAAALLKLVRASVLLALLALLFPGAAMAADDGTFLDSATYNAATGTLTVTGSNLVSTPGANNDIVASKFTFTGEGGATYTLTNTANVEITSGTSFTLALSVNDKAALNLIVNRNGTSSTSGTTYNLAAAEGWAAGADVAAADTTGNGITASNVAVPTISSAIYDASTGSLTVAGTGFLSLYGASNDIVANKFSFTGEGGAIYTLTNTANVDITSGTSFTLVLSANDKAALNLSVNRNGTSSTSGTTYNLAAAEDWAAGADAAVVTRDTTGNGISVSNVGVPTITSASYDASTGTVVVTGTGFLSRSGASNDIVASKFTFTGEGGATYTLTNTANVDITSGTDFTLVLSAADKAGVNQLINKNGTSATSGTTYNLAAAEDWAAGADAAVMVADTTGNGITASNINATPMVTTSSGSAAFTAGDNTASTPVAVDAGINVSDVGNGTLASATVSITGNFHAGEDVLAFTNDGATMGNIAASYNAVTGVLSLSSASATATLAQWQAALRAVAYTDTAITPDTATRTVSFTVNDGAADSTVATRTVTVAATDQTPIVTTTGSSTNYVGGASAVTIDTGITVSDLDNTTQSSATVSVTTGFHAGDALGFVNDGATMSNIASSYNSATGVMTLTSAGATATNTQWASALSSVTFASTSTSYGARTIAFAVNDGVKTSAVATNTVSLVGGLPTVTAVGSSTADGSYKVGDTITLTVDFDQAVVVDGSGGTPTLRLETGSVDREAVYVGGSGSSTLTFSYTVQAGDASADLDYASTAAFALNGASIRSSVGVDALLTLPATGGASSIAGQHAIVVDGVAPTVGSVTAPANGTYVAGQGLDFTVNYSEAVTVDTTGGTPRIAIVLDTGGTVYADYLSGSGTTALVFRYTVATGQNDANGITLAGAIDLNGGSIRDAAGNAQADGLNGVAATTYVRVDAVAPTASITLSNTALKIGDTSTVTITFSEAVSGLTTTDFSVANGSLGGLSSSDGGVTWTVTFTPAANITSGSNVISLDNTSVVDAAGNTGTGNTVSPNYAIDTVLVTASSITFGAQAAQTFVPNGTFTLDPLATASSGLTVSYSSQTMAVCTISGSTVTILEAGTCTIAADQAGDANYSAAPTVTQSIAIGAGSQSITFDTQAQQTFVPNGTFVLDPLATASSGLAVSYSTQTAAVCTITDSTVTMLSAGTCTIAADQAGDTNYSAAPTATQLIVIGKAAQSITGFAANPATPRFARNGKFDVSATGGASGNPVLFASTTSDVCSVNGSVVTILAADTCTLTADQAGDDNYSAAPQQVLDVTIAQATPTLAWIDSLQKIVGEAAFELSDPDSDSDGAFTFTSSDPTVATVDGHTVTIVAAGTVTLVAIQAGTRDYTEGMISLTLTVTSRPDPTRDPEVVGTLQAQVDASLRFIAAQQNNIQGRLRQLRAGNGNPPSTSLALNYAGAANGLALPLGSQMATKRLLPSGAWIAGTITVGRRDPSAGTGELGFRSDGLSAGFDRVIGEHLVMGVAGGYGWSDTDSGNASSIAGRQRSLAAYGLWHGLGQSFIDGVVGVGNLDFNIARWSAVASTTALARRSGDQVFATLTFGYEHAGEHMTLTSYGRYDASRTTLGAYTESGLGIYDLHYGRQAVDDSGIALGIEGRHEFKTVATGYRPYWLVEYRNALRDHSDVGINYVVQPATNDYVLGLRSSFNDALSVGVGLDMDLPRGWQLALQFRHEQAGSSRAESYGLQLTWGNPGAMPLQMDMQNPAQDPLASSNLQSWQQP